MAPTISREYLVVDINAYRLAKPERWECVAVRPRLQSTGAYVTEVLRVIGLPGETITFLDGKVVIDGQPLNPPEYLERLRFHAAPAEVGPGEQSVTVPNGHYYLLGDNPDEAQDSRIRGPYPASEIKGRVAGTR